MGRATMIAAAAILVAVPVVVVTSGAVDWLSGDSASAALFAEDVRLAPPSVSGDSTVEGTADLGVAGGPLDCPPTGAGPEDSELLFQRQGERFWVTGTLSSFDGATVVVAGPTGDTSAVLALEFNLVGNLSPGSAVQMTGTAASDGSMTGLEVRSVCAGAGVIDCATGEDPNFEFRIQGDTFEVIGRLDSLTSDRISVLGPGLVVEIARDEATAVEGGVDTGDPVRVEGTVGDAQQLRALAVALRCEEVLTPSPSPAPASAVREVQQQNDVCPSANGRGGAVRFEVDDDGEAEIKRGAVTANDGASLTVETPAGPVAVVLDDETKIKGDLASAATVTVKGDLQDDNSILADEVKVLCPDVEETNRDEDDGEKDKDKDKDKDKENDEDGDEQRGGGGDDEGEEGGEGED